MDYLQQLSDYIDISTCLLILSEILPFIQSIKGNGIADTLKNIIRPTLQSVVLQQQPHTVEVNLQSNTNKGKLSIEWGSD